MSIKQPTIIYTLTDEAPLLATSAFLPIIRAFTAPAGVNVETGDISVLRAYWAHFLNTSPKRSVCRTLWPNSAS